MLQVIPLTQFGQSGNQNESPGGFYCSLRLMNLVYEKFIQLNLLKADLCTAQTIWLHMHKDRRGNSYNRSEDYK